jgi:hypothetical protein
MMRLPSNIKALPRFSPGEMIQFSHVIPYHLQSRVVPDPLQQTSRIRDTGRNNPVDFNWGHDLSNQEQKLRISNIAKDIIQKSLVLL